MNCLHRRAEGATTPAVVTIAIESCEGSGQLLAAVARVERGGVRVVLTRDGEPVAALARSKIFVRLKSSTKPKTRIGNVWLMRRILSGRRRDGLLEFPTKTCLRALE